MSQIFFVRHGQASVDSEHYDQLSQLGHQQSFWLGEYFRQSGIVFDEVITGEMDRHRQTADSLLDGFGTPSLRRSENADWNEFNFDELIAQFLKKFPEQRPKDNRPRAMRSALLKTTLEHWANEKLDGDISEPWAKFEGRVSRQLSSLQSNQDSRNVLIVSSGGAISMALRIILESPASMMVKLNLQTRNASLSHCFFNKNGFILSSFNALPQLDNPERSAYISYY